ncbi:MAG: hypothetical protein J6Y62_04085 [Clostridia bacterium]|nr:hypothetical protein [Clostridia bacterium]
MPKNIEFGPDGVVDKDTGQKIDLNDPEFLSSMRRPPKKDAPEKPTDGKAEKEAPEKPDGVPPPSAPEEKPAGTAQEASCKAYGGPRPVSYGKYEVTPESEFTVRFCVSFEEGRWRVHLEEARYANPEYESHWAVFRMWTYPEMLSWRQQATEYDNMTGVSRLNTDKLNEIKLRRLLKRWSFEEYDPRYKLLHVGGVLSDESYSLLNGMFPTIVDNLIFMMNQVLEENR